MSNATNATERVERKYAYQRIAPGLVLQPGNDGATLYVVGRYEDGPTWGLEDEPRDFRAWGWGRVSADTLERVKRLTARGETDDAVYALREHVFDNTWPRHATMRAAIDAAVSSGRQ